MRTNHLQMLLQLAWILLLVLASAELCPYNPNPIDRGGLNPKMLIGIGAQKCGSSFVYNSLVGHPQIVPASNKELHLFGRDFNSSQGTFEEYLKHWGPLDRLKKLPEDRVLMEFTPEYLHAEQAPCQIKHLFPDAKFLVLLRDPVYRALSFMNMARGKCYQVKNRAYKCTDDFVRGAKRWPGMQQGQWIRCSEWFSDLTPRFKAAEELVSNHTRECLDAFTEEPWSNCPIEDIFVVSRGFYAPQVARWLKIFDQSQFLFINSKEFFDDPKSTWRKITKFAGLSDYIPEEAGQHTNSILFEDVKIDEITDIMNNMMQPSIEDLYKLFRDYGIDFPPFQKEGYEKKRNVVPTNKVLSRCAPQHLSLNNTRISEALVHFLNRLKRGFVAFTYLGFGLCGLSYYILSSTTKGKSKNRLSKFDAVIYKQA